MVQELKGMTYEQWLRRPGLFSLEEADWCTLQLQLPHEEIWKRGVYLFSLVFSSKF